MDVLTDVLNTMHLQSEVQYCMQLTSPWGIKASAVEDRAIFFAVTRGSCYIEIDKLGSPVSLAGGDLILLPHGNAYVLRDRLDSAVIPLEDFVKECPKHNGHGDLKRGGGGSLTAMVAGCFIFENVVSKPFLSSLPPLIHIFGESGHMAPWLETTLKWMASETASNIPGAQIIASRLTDILFIQIIRAHIAEQMKEGNCDGKAGLLRAMADSNLSRAFESIHEEPQHPWTVAELAAKSNMSRTAFSMRFTNLAGVPPLTYITKWRMLKAGDILRKGTATILEIAMQVGYESEASFGKAFKRIMGVAPGKYRRLE